MGDFRPPIRSDYPKDAGEKWDYCALCGPPLYLAVVHFDSGSVAPTADSYTVSTKTWDGGETVTGATSGDTGVIHRATLVSGTYAGGDAVGVLILRSPTGYDAAILEIFQNDENLNGSTAGANFATVNKIGGVSRSSRIIADKDLITYRGKKYCAQHFRFKFEHDWTDEIKVDRDEGDRE